jgi:phosphocarrier protein
VSQFSENRFVFSIGAPRADFGPPAIADFLANGKIMEITFPVTVRNRYGLHLRPATQLTQLASRARSSITLKKADGACADAKVMMEIMMLEASAGTELQVVVSGDDAESIASELREMFAQSFGVED